LGEGDTAKSGTIQSILKDGLREKGGEVGDREVLWTGVLIGKWNRSDSMDWILYQGAGSQRNESASREDKRRGGGKSEK